MTLFLKVHAHKAVLSCWCLSQRHVHDYGFHIYPGFVENINIWDFNYYEYMWCSWVESHSGIYLN